MNNDFASQYLTSLGYGRGWPLNASARLPAVLDCKELARLIVYGLDDDNSLETERDWMRSEQCGEVSYYLADACRRGLLKATMPPSESGAALGWNYKGFLVHFDDARRYFSALNIFPPDGSAVAAWLRGPDASPGSLSISAQDRADFQQLCIQQWERNSTQTITGEGGVVAAVGTAYLRRYQKSTLEKWAREVAPDFVKGRRGRPRKSDDSEK